MAGGTGRYGFDSVILVVADVENTETFYCQAFGLRPLERIRDELGVLISSVLEGLKVRILLTLEDEKHGTASPHKTGTSSTTIVVKVRDVDTMTQRFIEAGGILHSGPKDRYWGARAALVEDPEGHRWMLETSIASPAVEELQQAIQPWSYERLGL